MWIKIFDELINHFGRLVLYIQMIFTLEITYIIKYVKITKLAKIYSGNARSNHAQI